MKTLLLSALALTVAAASMFGEEPDKLKHPQKQAPPQRHVNNVPRSYTPRVQQQLRNKTQALQNTQNLNRTNTTKTFTPNVRTRTRTYTPNQNPTVNSNTNVTKENWNRNRTRTNTKVLTNPLNTTTQANTNRTVRNRNWQNRTTTNNTSRTFTYEQARRNFSRERHDRSWWRSRYNRIVLFGGGYYYWNDGYWYPAYGYDPYYSTYAYDEPIYGYNDLAPGQVIANVQTALQEQGYYRDAVDGLIGPNTRAALSAYQRDHGLPITAAIDGPTLQALGLA